MRVCELVPCGGFGAVGADVKGQGMLSPLIVFLLL